jgi:hypothetical protein
MLGRIIDDKTELRLPEVGVLLDGRTVSNYDCLPLETLTAEGWLPYEEIKPEHDEATQMLVVDSAVRQADKIVVTYLAVDKPVDEAEALEDLLLEELEG